jgi:tRNA/tmRNA/rRNA uracil-C5-methylase (TrmA/RlmC/RlmD family)
MFKVLDGTIKDGNWYRDVYLNSPHWRALRASKLALKPVCELCGSSRNIQVHHSNYRLIFDVTTDDLVTLCEFCHQDEHEFLEKQKRKEQSIRDKARFKLRKQQRKEARRERRRMRNLEYEEWKRNPLRMNRR